MTPEQKKSGLIRLAEHLGYTPEEVEELLVENGVLPLEPK